VRYFFCFIIQFIFNWKYSQGQSYAKYERLIEVFDTTNIKGNQLLLRTPYNGPNIINQEALERLKGVDPLRVELFYTKFQRSEKFDQGRLNQQRWAQLEKNLPGITSDVAIAYYETGQTEVVSLQNGRMMFHGFLVTFRSGADSLSYQNEFARLSAFLDLFGTKAKNADNTPRHISSKTGVYKMPGKTQQTQFKGGESALKEYLAERLKFPEGFRKGLCFGTVNLRFTIDTLGAVKAPKIASGLGSPCDEFAMLSLSTMPNWIPGKIDGKASETNFMLPIKFVPDKKGAIVGDLITNNTFVPHSNGFTNLAIPAPIGFEKLDETAESIVTFSLNKRVFKNAALVVDVTASMGPYLGQTIKWLDKNLSKGNFKRAYFFNDGDGKPNSQKVVGSTGGIYQTECKDINKVKETLLKACNAGGDMPENNIEALIKAQETCPNCEQLVMIADNMATPRDMALLPLVKIPVHILLCGSRYAANTNYLEIAKATGGSVMILNGETPDLTRLKEGEEFKLGLFTFQYKNAKFIKTFK
jgi:hypothetical protein